MFLQIKENNKLYCEGATPHDAAPSISANRARKEDLSTRDIDLATDIDRRRAYIDGEIAWLVKPAAFHFIVIAEVFALDDIAHHLALPWLEVDFLEVLQLLLGTDDGALVIGDIELHHLLAFDLADIGDFDTDGARIDGGYTISELRVAQTIAEGENYARGSHTIELVIVVPAIAYKDVLGIDFHFVACTLMG